MLLASLLAALSTAPAVVIALRARSAPSLRSLFASLALYLAVIGAGFALRRADVLTPLYPGGNDDRGFMSLAALVVHGYGVAFPALGLAIGAWGLARRRARRGVGLIVASLVAGLVALQALVIEPSMLVVREARLRSPRAPRGGLTILHVSDLQTDGPCRRERLAIEAASRELPDFVVFTGDLTNGLGAREHPELRARAAHDFLKGLHARYAVLAVYGDWDAWGPEWPAWERRIFENTGAHMLYNRALTFDLPGGPVVIYGAGGGGPTPMTLVADMHGVNGYRVIIGHHPDVLSDGLVEGGADLVLAGHTHGGQVVLPFVGALVTHSVRGFVGGEYAVKHTPFLVSRGIGMRGGEAPRVRLGCPPEITWVRVARD